jgi:hypothetical protein
MVLQEVCVRKCSQNKGIISAQSTLLRSATFMHPGHMQQFWMNLARKSYCGMDVIHNLFHKVISRFGDAPWSARSPDIKVPDFFLGGYLKE